MKTLGAILLIIGLLVSLVGYGQYANVECHCPNQIVGQPSDCDCVDTPQQYFGHIMTYVGIVISSIGVILFVRGWRKRKLFTTN
jgi:hypothetical protein